MNYREINEDISINIDSADGNIYIGNENGSGASYPVDFSEPKQLVNQIAEHLKDYLYTYIIPNSENLNEYKNSLLAGKILTVGGKPGFTETEFKYDGTNVLYKNSEITGNKFMEHQNSLTQILNHFSNMEKEGFTITAKEPQKENKEIKPYKVSFKEGCELINKLEKGEDIGGPFYFQNGQGIFNSVIPTSGNDKYFIEAFKNETIARKYIENEDIPVELLSLEDDLVTLYYQEDFVKVTESLKYNLLAVEEIEGHSIVSSNSLYSVRETGELLDSLLRDMERSECDSFGDLVDNIKDDLELEDYLDKKILDEEPTLISQDRLDGGLLVKLRNSGEYFQIHTTDTGFDFTLYDKDKKEVDGGLKLYRSPEVRSDYLPLSYILKECASMIDRENDVKLENIALYSEGYCIEDDLPDVSEDEPEM